VSKGTSDVFSSCSPSSSVCRPRWTVALPPSSPYLNVAGGAISARNASTVEIITSSFTENVAENGGAIYLEMCEKAAMADNTFTSNRANKQGGGIFQTKCSGVQ
jgi:predicted outer membrane repeat protein